MSALDQAFIKVFQQGTRPPAAAPTIAVPPTDAHQASSAAVDRDVASSQGTPAVDSLYAEGAFYRDSDAAEPFPQPATGPHSPSMRRRAPAAAPEREELAARDGNRWALDPAPGHTEAATGRNDAPGVPATPDAPDTQWVFPTADHAESCHMLVESGQLDANEVRDVGANVNLLDMEWLDDHLLTLQTRQSAPANASHVEPIVPEADSAATPEIKAEAIATETAAPKTATSPVAAPAEATVQPATIETAEPVASESGAGADSESGEAGAVGETAEVAWEVDRLQWPEVCDQLYQARRAHFDHCGQKLLAATGEGLRALAVSSSERGEGRTTLALCMARAAAAAGVRVAVLEADFDHASLGGLLRVETPCDWPHAVRNELPWTEAAIWSVEDRITLLPLSDEEDLPSLRLDDARVTRLIDSLRDEFDLLVIDMPPIGDSHSEFFETGDACPIDATILVRDQRVAVAAHTLRIVERLRDAGVEAVGIAHNYSKVPTE
jgi:Mrp family chromosome partitioning ATPase